MPDDLTDNHEQPAAAVTDSSDSASEPETLDDSDARAEANQAGDVRMRADEHESQVEQDAASADAPTAPEDAEEGADAPDEAVGEEIEAEASTEVTDEAVGEEIEAEESAEVTDEVVGEEIEAEESAEVNDEAVGEEIEAEKSADEAVAEEEDATDDESTSAEGEEGEEDEGEADEVEEAEPPSNLHWYIVKVQSGREETIKDAIERRVKIDGLEEHFGQIFIPTEQRTDVRRGKSYTRTAKKLPGYIMAEVEFNDRMLYLFRETAGVGDFVGGTITRPPPPMTPEEIARWIGKDKVTDEELEASKPARAADAPVSKGERVRVKTGMFDGMEGEVLDILAEKSLVKVELTIFGRPVEAELEYWHVEPLD